MRGLTGAVDEGENSLPPDFLKEVMKVLLLSQSVELRNYLENDGCEIVQDALVADFIVSYGHREIISKDIVDLFPRRAINLHTSFLPWNRGASPNFWSFFRHTPKGVTIHLMDEGIDTGDIIVQREVLFSTDETLRTSYEKLHKEMLELFFASWPIIKTGKFISRPQGMGSYHGKKESEEHLAILSKGYDTPVVQFLGFEGWGDVFA